MIYIGYNFENNLALCNSNLHKILISTVMMKPNNKAPNWSKPDTFILDFSRCITSNMTTYNKAPEHTPRNKLKKV